MKRSISPVMQAGSWLMIWCYGYQQTTSVLLISVDFVKKGNVPFLVQSPHGIMPWAWFWFSLAIVHCWMMICLCHFWPWHFWKVDGYCCVDHPVLSLFLILLLAHLHEVFSHFLHLHHAGMPSIWKLRQSAARYIRAESSRHLHW